MKYIHLISVRKSLHFTFIFKNGTLVAFGFNTRTFLTSGKYSKHSEEAAIQKLKALTRNNGMHPRQYSLVNIRITKTGELKNAKPCESCQKIILKTGIKKIYASNDNGDIIRVDTE